MSPLVLIVEDDLEALKLFSLIVERGHYEVMRATNRATALDILERATPDLVLLDLALPLESTGIELIRFIRRNHKLQNTKVVAVTARPHLLKAAYSNGADKFILKPIRPADLLGSNPPNTIVSSMPSLSLVSEVAFS